MPVSRLGRKVATWVVVAFVGALSVGRPVGSTAGSGPMTPFDRTVRAAQRDGVVFRTTLAEAEAETRLSFHGSGTLTQLANESLEALSERPGRSQVRHYAAMTEATAIGSGGSTAAVEGSDTAFERWIWLSVRNGSVPAQSVGSRAELLAEAVRSVTGQVAEPVAAAAGECGKPCQDMGPETLAAQVFRASGARVVERVAGPGMAVVLGCGGGAPAVDVAGRNVNLEVVVTRTQQGLMAQIGAPFVPPGWSALRSV